MRGDRVLIDTSVWIEYLRDKDSPIGERVDEILATCEVFVPKVVLAELVQGSKSEKEVAAIEGFIEAFHVVDQTEDTWSKAGRLSFSLKRKGATVNLIDCYIAVMANENNCKILSLDEHFRTIRDVLEIAVLE